MRAKLVFVVAVTAVALFMFPGASSAKAAPTSVDLSTATCESATGTPVACTVEVVGFSNAGGQLAAVLSVTNEVTGQTRRVLEPITSQQQGGTCTILDLTIGPIDLFLLGIRIQTNEIHILITAQRGTLLGDLLCGLFFGPANPLAGTLNEAFRQGTASGVATG